MKIGYIERCSSEPEKEVFARFKTAFESLGHSLHVLDLYGFDPDGNYADDLNLDVCLATDFSDDFQRQLPNVPCVFIKWVPSGYLTSDYNRNFFYKSALFDIWLSNSALSETALLAQLCGDSKIFYYKDLLCLPSPSSSCCLPPNPNASYNLFYIGKNSEKRFSNLLKNLDSDNNIKIFGPKKSWIGYSNYVKEIPCDGKSLLNEINKCGICLALVSKEHLRTGHITSRIWEGIAAGATCITVRNKEIEDIFGDTLYYVDIEQDETSLYNEISSIVSAIKANKEEHLQKARKAQKIFIEKCSGEITAKNIELSLYRFNDDIKKEGQNALIDIIAFINEESDLPHILSQIRSQTHKKIFLHLITRNGIKINTNELNGLEYSVYNSKDMNRGKAFASICGELKGKAFAFIDKSVSWQFRFLYKSYRYLTERHLNFAYCGTYYQNIDNNGKTINFQYLLDDSFSMENLTKPLKRDFSEDSYILTEEKFSLGCCLFSSEILKTIDTARMSLFYNSPHIYLALSSYLKNHNSGKFMRFYACGYRKNMENKELIGEYGSSFYYETGRPGILTSAAIIHSFSDYLVLTDNSDGNSETASYNKILKSLAKKYAKFEIMIYKCKRLLAFSPKKKQEIREKIKYLQQFTR